MDYIIFKRRRDLNDACLIIIMIINGDEDYIIG